MQVFIHTGFLSVENGAKGPLAVYFDLAKLVGVCADTGQYYGDDSLDIPDESWPIVEELLIEAKMLYRVRQVHNCWQNVQTDAVRQLLSPRVVH